MPYELLPGDPAAGSGRNLRLFRYAGNDASVRSAAVWLSAKTSVFRGGTAGGRDGASGAAPCVHSDGYLYQRVIGSATGINSNNWSVERLINCIDFAQLYKDNPKFDVSKFDTQSVKPTKSHIN